MIIVLFFFSIFLLTYLPVIDTDFGWHYQCGKEMFTLGKLCTKNTFTYYLSDYQWANSNFLYDLLTFGIFDQTGFLGIAVLGSLVFVLIALMLWFLFKGSTLVKMIFIYLLFLLPSWSIISLGFRSQIASLLFYTVTLFLIHYLNQAKKRKQQLLFLSLLALTFILWSNSHPSAFMGPLVFFLFATGQVFKRQYQYIIYAVLLFLVTWLNPFTYKIYFEVWFHFITPMHQLIAEWVSPVVWQQIIIVLFVGVYLSSIYLLKKKVKISLYYLLLLSLVTYLGLTARRNLPIFYLTYSYIFLNTITLSVNINKETLKMVKRGLVVCVLLISLLQLPKSIKANKDLAFYCQNRLSKMPCAAVKVLKKTTKINIFNAYEWGGFLIWQLPQNKIFVDGRMPAWQTKSKKSPYTVYLEIIQAKPGWNRKLRKYKTDFLLIPKGTFLDLLLQKKGEKYGWKQIHQDPIAIIYRKVAK